MTNEYPVQVHEIMWCATNKLLHLCRIQRKGYLMALIAGTNLDSKYRRAICKLFQIVIHLASYADA